LADSTLLDNCGATHLVNDINLLDGGKYDRTTSDNIMEYRTSSIDIIGRGTCIIKNCLYSERGPNTEDLVLTNVVLVPGFHMNIVLEARLRDSDL
jgi:hypothetical protein